MHAWSILFVCHKKKKTRSKLGVDKIIIISEDMGWERLSEPVAFKLRPESWKEFSSGTSDNQCS